MDLKTYQKWKMGVVFVLALVISQSLVAENFIIPIMAIIVGSLAMFYLKSQVKEVIADERDYLIAGRASLLAMQIFGWFGVILMFILYSQKGINPYYESIALTLSYSVLFLFFVYAIIYRYYHKLGFLTKKKVYLVLIAALIVLVALFGVRVFSGEDNWVCKDGQWQKHGNPSFPAPSVECK